MQSIEFHQTGTREPAVGVRTGRTARIVIGILVVWVVIWFAATAIGALGSDRDSSAVGVGRVVRENVVDSPRFIGHGIASYYARSFEGLPTASGEPYRGAGLTAAHRTLPFGTRVRVTNPATGWSVIVRINDRGPFHRDRVIDLSRAAADRLGLLEVGHGEVRIELLPELGEIAPR